jgi:hypothetical protein
MHGIGKGGIYGYHFSPDALVMCKLSIVLIFKRTENGNFIKTLPIPEMLKLCVL